MREKIKTKNQLINEIQELRLRIADMETSEIRCQQVEKKLKETENIFRLFMEYCPVYVFFKDDKIRSLQLSRNFEQMLGRPIHELLGKSMDDLFPSELAKSMIEDDTLILREGKPLEVEEELNGRIYSTLKFPISQDGAPKYLAGFTVDITDRKKIEEALRESEKKYSTIIEKSNDGIVILQDGVFKLINPKMEEMSHFPVRDLLGKAFVDYVAPNFKNLVIQRYQKRIAGESVPDRYEIEIITREGPTIPVEISPSLIEYEGKPADMAIIRDITERKKVEQEMVITQKLESVGILAGGIAHDFNNLLQTIWGNISLAKIYLATHSQEEISSLLERAEETLETAKQLSFRLLTFSKGGDPLRRVFPAKDILRKSIGLSLSGSNVTCDLELPHDLWPIEIDEGQMTQVFNNILINAKEAMPDGGTISISARNSVISEGDHLPLKKGDYVQISIKDHGNGMPEDIISKIFDPFFSTKGMGSRKGSGLGLSICLSVVTKHEGYISVESEKGRGTTFHVFLPASNRKSVGQETITVQPQAIARRKLLFMDDDANIRHLVREMMEYLGYEAEFAKNGEEAIALYRRSRESGETFDIVILDLTVQGGMGGDKAIQKLIEIDPDVKAVISSGYADAPVIRDYKKYGFMDAMVKPYRMDQLEGILDSLFRSPGNH